MRGLNTMISPESLTEEAQQLVARRTRLLQELHDVEEKLASTDPSLQLAQLGRAMDAGSAAGPSVSLETTRQVLVSLIHKGRMYHIRAFCTPEGWGGTVAVHDSHGVIRGYMPFDPPKTFRSKREVVSAFTIATNEWIDKQLADEAQAS
jgi:hypothetical protein